MRCRGNARFWLAGVLAVSMLVATGAGYRAAVARVGDPAPIPLPLPLAAIPSQQGEWTATDLEIRSVTQDYMTTHFADDYISRRYVHSDAQTWADVYVVYCSSRPAGLVGHKPSVCFVRSGWIADGTSHSEFESASGRRIECLVHRFHRPMPDYRSIVVLSFYVLNGKTTRNEREFADFWGRRLNLAGDPARYVAQIQVSAVQEESARTVIGAVADTILAYLPDKEGRVKAVAGTPEPGRKEGTGQPQ